ncbi:MAG TPA: P1 family peptidase [Bryobacteraceae bacterium]|jgi:L-aminopeptidase/D-esterase-like protein|nr:P1 family peptidase [Bryobacteraceae bacterium]
MKGLTDITGIKVGHASNFEALTGVTVILCEGGAVAGGDIRGSATGTQEWDTLSPTHVTPAIHAVVFSGGSAFGLEAASGVRRFLSAKGVGFETRAARVPIVPSAILYDLGLGKTKVTPTRELGEAAAAAATDGPVNEGSVGAGTGATVGKVLGITHAMKGGIGSYSLQLDGAFSRVQVAALVAVNAYGDVVDPASGKVVAGTRTRPDSKEFARSDKLVMSGNRRGFGGENTTLVAVATNAKLTKVEATRVAQMAQQGLVRAVSPAQTTIDGDVSIALSLGSESCPVNAVGTAAAEVVAQAILRAVRLAKGLGGVPGLGG